jgi:hypothetical protein
MIALREERKVIVEQWIDFVEIAVETDPAMLTMQGRAFLRKLDALNKQALVALSEPRKAQELQLQWHESEQMGEALLTKLEAHRSAREDTPAWHSMHDGLRDLAQQLLYRRNGLRAQILAVGPAPGS